jgi:outer membrane translocation and assembly module TamA
VVRSVNNLYNFGLFDLALIDSTSHTQAATDSTIALRVLTRTRRIHSTDIGTFIGQIANTSLLEMGANARYENKNLFGSAQNLSLQAQIALVDVNTFVNNLLAGSLVNARLEGLLSARFAYPLFANLFGRRIDLESRFSVSLQSLAFVALAAPLLLETEKLYASLPMVLPQNDLFNSLFLEINLDRQRPINFEATQTQALALAKTQADRDIINQQLLQYSLLNSLYTGSSTPFLLTSTIITVGARGDHRDNLFNPRKGYFLDFSVDAAVPPGASEFIRISADTRWYQALSKQMVFAAKIRGGHTLLLNPRLTFVPIERHFFAGGSNSIRGWNVRDLRVRTGEQSAVLPELAFVGQFIGSGSLLEGSAEWRYSFAAESNEYGTFWERQFAKLGIAGFVDMGNAFNSFLEPPENYGKLPLAEIAQNIAIAAGVGLRYDTSVGPFRIDVALRVYDPAKRLFFFQIPTPTLQNLFNIQIGLGHAF